ncbi:MAG: hypothetical protein Sylvanvirus38_4 [Sylvanvirus sp.]|uniref:Uncharacterized protein n=1 Tax=Sylvanvirus sp. TaxID=2487774 RepID=A0A3G5AJ48_9VIRU|nr:MAG: hypothetical protein Sylvanvirus38_4 [Sylvanvirus sp.]
MSIHSRVFSFDGDIYQMILESDEKEICEQVKSNGVWVELINLLLLHWNCSYRPFRDNCVRCPACFLVFEGHGPCPHIIEKDGSFHRWNNPNDQVIIKLLTAIIRYAPLHLLLTLHSEEYIHGFVFKCSYWFDKKECLPLLRELITRVFKHMKNPLLHLKRMTSVYEHAMEDDKYRYTSASFNLLQSEISALEDTEHDDSDHLDSSKY